VTDAPKISILVAGDDHPPDLERFFGALMNQSLPPHDYEVVIIDADLAHDYRPALARALARKDPRLRIHFETIEKAGRASAHNCALRIARAPIILFLADDHIAGPCMAEAHLCFHRENPELHRVGIGAVLVPERLRTHFTDWLERSGSLFGAPFSAEMTSVPEDFFYVGNASVKRNFLQAAGPFDEGFRHHAWDDLELGGRLRRLGMKASFVPNATAEHDHHIPLAERCRLIAIAGESAADRDARGGAEPIWRRKRWVPTWCFRLYASAAWLRHALSRRERHLIAYYQVRLAAAFVEGYRRRHAAAAEQGFRQP
jgi:GT2 family glycosyltransferase